MKNFQHTVATGLALAAGLLSGCNSIHKVVPAPVPPSNSATIDEVVSQVQATLKEAQDSLWTQHFPVLTSVKLTLQTDTVKSVDGGINVWIITADSSAEKDTTEKLELTLEPPQGGAITKTSTETISEDLKKAIMEVSKSIDKAKAGDYPLVPKAIAFTLSFTVKVNASLGGKIILTPVSPSLTGKVNESSVQTLVVTYGKDSGADTPK